MPGSNGKDDRFGSSLAVGDFAVGVPGEDFGDADGIKGAAQANDYFGTTVGAGGGS